MIVHVDIRISLRSREDEIYFRKYFSQCCRLSWIDFILNISLLGYRNVKNKGVVGTDVIS